MLLKYLELQGFKSFPDKTKITFGKGLTAVVGPNGSGKSNICDAVRWVMGEQSTKTLRGSKMEDVIFSGTKNRRSQGFAEVSLTFDNRDRTLAVEQDEVTITRRYDRSGDSTYQINHTQVRLKDLQELLMDTGLGKDGYAMVGQGRIAEIVQAKSTERREIFEEAAGISKFRYRKAEAERSLERAEENLLRLRDILTELEARIGPLKEQSEKAKRFLTLSAEKKQLEVSLWVDTLDRSNRQLKDQSDRILIGRTQHGEIENRIEALEQEVQDTFAAMQSCMTAADEKRQEKEELEGEIAQIQAQIAVCRNNIERNDADIVKLETELTQFNENAKHFEETRTQREAALVQRKQALEQHRESILKKQEELLSHTEESDRLSKEEQALVEQHNRLLLNQSNGRLSLDNLEQQKTMLQETLERNRTELLERQAEQEKILEELAKTKQFLSQIADQLTVAVNQKSGQGIKLENRRKRMEENRAVCDRLMLEVKGLEQKKAMLEAMEQSMEGYAHSVKEVLKQARRGVLDGVYGTLSQLITVEPEYGVAVETALGGAMQHIVVRDEEVAKAGIRYLNQNNAGRATFRPLTSTRGTLLQVQGLDQYAGYVDLAYNLVKADPMYDTVLKYHLGRTVVVDDIDTAVAMARKYKHEFRIVTLDGQEINPGGAMTGGSRNKGQSFLSRRNEIQALKDRLNVLSVQCEQAKAQQNQYVAEVEKLQAEYQSVSDVEKTLREDEIRVQGEQKRLQELSQRDAQTVLAMQTELREKENQLQGLDAQALELRASMQKLEQDLQTVGDDLIRMQENNRSVMLKKAEFAETLSALQLTGVTLQKDIEAEEQALLLLSQQTQDVSAQMDRLRLDITGYRSQNDLQRQEIATLEMITMEKRAEITGILEAVEQVLAKRQSLEGHTTELRQQERELSGEKEKLYSEIARLEEKKEQLQRDYDTIITKLWDEYELTRSEASELATKLESVQKATGELNSVKAKIRSLGSVNVEAIDEYTAVSERYRFLNEQVEDAEKSRSSLLRLIGELTQKMETIFGECFTRINEHFSRIFVELFGGGSANLHLTQPDQILESGIEIQVEPPGKIIRNLASLSGGEQAFVAIAIYFAILKVRPAPFCILDEIEAALDDVNVDKYAEYLRSLAEFTQFIMITHRRGSMEAADVLYGVTMQDEGVSKLLRLDAAEAERRMLERGSESNGTV